MPWTGATPTDHRRQFVAEARRADASFTALCGRHGVAPETGYKWLARHDAEGPAGLHERSRRPHASPTATPPAVTDALLELRRRHPTWGGTKLLAVLGRRRPRLVLAAPSTVAALLKHAGLVATPRRLPAPEYPAHWEVCRVSRNGGVRWGADWVNVSHALAEEYVAFEELAGGLWQVYFGPLRVGRSHEPLLKIVDQHDGATSRNPRRVSPMSSD